MAISKTEMKEVIIKLDSMEIEILKLKATILPKEKATKRELNEIKKAKAEIVKGSWVSGRDLAKKLG